MCPINVNKNNRPRKNRGHVVLNMERCKGCGFCVEFCPTHVLGIDNYLNSKGYHPPKIVKPEACTGCDLCGLYCPDFAIHGYRMKIFKNDHNQKGGNS